MYVYIYTYYVYVQFIYVYMYLGKYLPITSEWLGGKHKKIETIPK